MSLEFLRFLDLNSLPSERLGRGTTYLLRVTTLLPVRVDGSLPTGWTGSSVLPSRLCPNHESAELYCEYQRTHCATLICCRFAMMGVAGVVSIIDSVH